MAKFSIIAGAVLAGALITSASAAGLHRSAAPSIDNTVIEVGTKLSGKQKLQRVLRTHTFRYPITRDIRAAAGNPNMAVFDHRTGFTGTTYRCSYITYRSQKALVCD